MRHLLAVYRAGTGSFTSGSRWNLHPHLVKVGIEFKERNGNELEGAQNHGLSVSLPCFRPEGGIGQRYGGRRIVEGRDQHWALNATPFADNS
jgi:hypothetical protein